MKNKPSPTELDQSLRDGAADRRATIDRLAPAYPVGEYPVRDPDHRVQLTGPGVLPRLARLLGVGTLVTAALLGLVTLTSLLLSPAPTGPIVAAHPQPDALGPSVRSLVAGLGQVEADLGDRLNPTVALATAWPRRIETIPDAILDAEQSLQQPLTTEFTALRGDLQTAADYLRRQWRDAPESTPSGELDRGSNPTVTG